MAKLLPSDSAYHQTVLHRIISTALSVREAKKETIKGHLVLLEVPPSNIIVDVPSSPILTIFFCSP